MRWWLVICVAPKSKFPTKIFTFTQWAVSKESSLNTAWGRGRELMKNQLFFFFPCSKTPAIVECFFFLLNLIIFYWWSISSSGSHLRTGNAVSCLQSSEKLIFPFLRKAKVLLSARSAVTTLQTIFSQEHESEGSHSVLMNWQGEKCSPTGFQKMSGEWISKKTKL